MGTVVRYIRSELHCQANAEQKPKLLDRVRDAIRVRHYSRRTEQAYVHRIKRFIVFHGVCHPKTTGKAEISQFLTPLAVYKNVSASTQNQAFNALLFLYKEVLDTDIGFVDGVVRARRPKRIAVVLTRQEVRAVLEQLEGVLLLVCTMLYRAGLRLLECLGMRVKDIDFS